MFRYYIKQIDSMLPCICSVIYHRGCQNVVKTSATHLASTLCGTFFFLPHFDVICDILLNSHAWQHGIYLLNLVHAITTTHYRVYFHVVHRIYIIPLLSWRTCTCWTMKIIINLLTKTGTSEIETAHATSYR